MHASMHAHKDSLAKKHLVFYIPGVKNYTKTSFLQKNQSNSKPCELAGAELACQHNITASLDSIEALIWPQNNIC